MNALGLPACERHKARVLFTTHAMLERRVLDHGSFSAASDLHYRGKPRAVRIWDEALMPGKPLALPCSAINVLPHFLRREYPKLAVEVERLAQYVKSQPDGSQIDIPDLGVRHGVDINQTRLALSAAKSDVEAMASTLWHLFGRTVTVRRDGFLGNSILDYRDALPNDLWPVLILDASGRVRTTYSLWEKRRGRLVRLPEGPKNYEGHTVHVWSCAAGKSAWRRTEKARQLVEGIVSAIRERPWERWLVIVHLPKSIARFDVAEEVRKRLPPDADVSFTTWGKHDATNAFADIPNVILAGTLFFPSSLTEAIGRCAAGLPSSEGAFAKSDIDAVELGEYLHFILQAMCRGSVRKSEGSGCPANTHTYIIANARSGIGKAIGGILPGAAIVGSVAGLVGN